MDVCSIYCIYCVLRVYRINDQEVGNVMLMSVPIGSSLAQGLEILGLDCKYYRVRTMLCKRLLLQPNQIPQYNISCVLYGKHYWYRIYMYSY